MSTKVHSNWLSRLQVAKVLLESEMEVLELRPARDAAELAYALPVAFAQLGLLQADDICECSRQLSCVYKIPSVGA